MRVLVVKLNRISTDFDNTILGLHKHLGGFTLTQSHTQGVQLGKHSYLTCSYRPTNVSNPRAWLGGWRRCLVY